MRDPKPYSRARSRERFRVWASSRRGTIGSMIAVVVAVLLVEAWLISILMPRWSALVTGALVGAGVVGVGWLVHAMFLASDSGAVRDLRGAWGEDLTRDALVRATRRKLVWGAVHSIQLEKTDLGSPRGSAQGLARGHRLEVAHGAS